MPKKAIIVGASSGIGKALALLLSKEGFSVGVTGRRTAALEAIKSHFPKAIHVLSFDITQEDATNMLDQLANSMGGVDLFIFSAGIGHLNIDLDYTLENQTNQLNIVAFTKAMNWALHYFKKQDSGHLVNISSVAMHRGGRSAPAYNASKAYQANYLEGLLQKVYAEKRTIYISDIRPGFVDTAMAKGEGLFWVSSKEKAAKQIYRAIKKKREVAYITKRWALIGLLVSLLPKAIYKRL